MRHEYSLSLDLLCLWYTNSVFVLSPGAKSWIAVLRPSFSVVTCRVPLSPRWRQGGPCDGWPRASTQPTRRVRSKEWSGESGETLPDVSFQMPPFRIVPL